MNSVEKQSIGNYHSGEKLFYSRESEFIERNPTISLEQLTLTPKAIQSPNSWEGSAQEWPLKSHVSSDIALSACDTPDAGQNKKKVESMPHSRIPSQSNIQKENEANLQKAQKSESNRHKEKPKRLSEANSLELKGLKQTSGKKDSLNKIEQGRSTPLNEVSFKDTKSNRSLTSENSLEGINKSENYVEKVTRSDKKMKVKEKVENSVSEENKEIEFTWEEIDTNSKDEGNTSTRSNRDKIIQRKTEKEETPKSSERNSVNISHSVSIQESQMNDSRNGSSVEMEKNSLKSVESSHQEPEEEKKNHRKGDLKEKIKKSVEKRKIKGLKSEKNEEQSVQGIQSQSNLSEQSVSNGQKSGENSRIQRENSECSQTNAEYELNNENIVPENMHSAQEESFGNNPSQEKALEESKQSIQHGNESDSLTNKSNKGNENLKLSERSEKDRATPNFHNQNSLSSINDSKEKIEQFSLTQNEPSSGSRNQVNSKNGSRKLSRDSIISKRTISPSVKYGTSGKERESDLESKSSSKKGKKVSHGGGEVNLNQSYMRKYATGGSKTATDDEKPSPESKKQHRVQYKSDGVFTSEDLWSEKPADSDIESMGYSDKYEKSLRNKEYETVPVDRREMSQIEESCQSVNESGSKNKKELQESSDSCNERDSDIERVYDSHKETEKEEASYSKKEPIGNNSNSQDEESYRNNEIIRDNLNNEDKEERRVGNRILQDETFGGNKNNSNEIEDIKAGEILENEHEQSFGGNIKVDDERSFRSSSDHIQESVGFLLRRPEVEEKGIQTFSRESSVREYASDRKSQQELKKDEICGDNLDWKDLKSMYKVQEKVKKFICYFSK